MKKTKVLIIDDSALTRSILTEIIGSDPRIEIVGTAYDPIMAFDKMPKLNPDVLTLDLVMPKMDGITFLKKLAKENPIPTVLISGNSPKDSLAAIQALENGAVDIIEKPDISSDAKYKEVSQTICDSIVEAGLSKRVSQRDYCIGTITKKVEVLPSKKLSASQFYVIGASTGGPNLLNSMFSGISASVKKGFVIAQHIPVGFSKGLADRMNANSDLEVVEATPGERIENGKVILIPGGKHGLVRSDAHGFYIELNETEKVNRHRPSVDVLFESAAKVASRSVAGILLTGMGNDGAAGLKKIREVGGNTIAQDEESCVVYGMPRVAREMDAVDFIASPLEIVQIINEHG